MPRKIARRLRWLEIGSQAMSVGEKQAIRRMFPAARIIQHYGPDRSLAHHFPRFAGGKRRAARHGGAPGRKTEVKIDADRHICIRGPHVADGILTANGLQPVVDGDGWLRTRDLGSIGDDGLPNVRGTRRRPDEYRRDQGSGELFERKLGEAWARTG